MAVVIGDYSVFMTSTASKSKLNILFNYSIIQLSNYWNTSSSVGVHGRDHLA